MTIVYQGTPGERLVIRPATTEGRWVVYDAARRLVVFEGSLPECRDYARLARRQLYGAAA